MDDDIVVIRTYGTEAEAHVAQAVLAASGVPSIVLPDNAGGMLPMLQVLFPVRLAVRSVDAEAAQEVLDAPPGSPDTGADGNGEAPLWQDREE